MATPPDDPRATSASTAAPGHLRIVPYAAVQTRLAGDGAGANEDPLAHRTLAQALDDLVQLAAAATHAPLVRLEVLAPQHLCWASDAGAPALPDAGARALESVCAAGAPGTIADLAGHPDTLHAHAAGAFAGYRAACYAPLRVAGSVRGSLVALYREPRPDPVAICRALERVSRLAASLVGAHRGRGQSRRRQRERRHVERALQQLQEAAHRAVAARLHEDVANHLVGTALLVRSALQSAAPLPNLHDRLGGVLAELEAVLGTVRELAYGNTGYLIQSYGLAHALVGTLRALSVPGAARCGVIAEAEAGAGLSLTQGLAIVHLAMAAARLALAPPGTRHVTVRLRGRRCGGVRLTVAADASWLEAPARTGPDPAQWAIVRHEAGRIGAELRLSTPAGPGMHRLDVVLRRLRPAGRASRR